MTKYLNRQHGIIMSNFDGLTIYSPYCAKFANHRKALRNYKLKNQLLPILVIAFFLVALALTGHADSVALNAGIIH